MSLEVPSDQGVMESEGGNLDKEGIFWELPFVVVRI